MSYFRHIKKLRTFYKTFNTASAKETNGQFADAIGDFLFAVSLNPSCMPVYRSLIRLYKQQKLYQYALDYAKTASLKFPQNAFFLAQQADIYRRMKEYAAAVDMYDKAAAIDNRCIDYYIARAKIKYYMNNIQGALSDYNTPVLRNKKSADLYAQRAFYHFEKKNYKSAAEDYTKAIELNPKKLHFYFMRSCACKLLGNSEAAEKDMKIYEGKL